jgi:uncharacterized membrane protein YgaE (UPF0421/DUF939 family)
MKLGARILKTGIAITLALFLAQLFHLPSPMFAGIAATFAIKPTIYRSYLSIIEQIQGNVIGAVIAVVLVIFFGNHFLIVGLGAIMTIIIMLKLRLENNISLGLVTMIAIMESTGQHFLQFAGIRFSTLLLGILSSFIVNLVFLPPKYEKKLYLRISNMTEDILKWMRLTARRESDYQLLKNDIKKFKERLNKVNEFYTLFNEERGYLQRIKKDKKRKLVIYKQMVFVLQISFNILKMLHRFENELCHMSDNMKLLLQERLDSLSNEHEKLLLMFLGKVRPLAETDSHLIMVQSDELMNLFISEIKEHHIQDQVQTYHLMRLLSTIVEYQDQLRHLGIFIDSYQTYHHGKNEVVIEEGMDE